MKLKEINRTAIQAWSPAQQHPIYLAAGTSAQQLDATFSTNASLEIFELDLADSALAMKSCGSFSSPHRYHKLVWGPHGIENQGLPSGVLIAGGENGNIILYDASKIIAGDSEVIILQSEKHTGAVRALDVNSFQSNLVASGGNESEIYIWDLNNFSSPMTPGPKTQPQEDISCVAWNKQVQHILASASPSGKASVWDLRKNDLIIKVSDHSNRMHCSGLAWNPEVATQLVLASEDDRMPVIQMWDLRFATSPLKVLENHTRGILAIAWSVADPELLLSCGKDNRILCWNPNTAEVLYELPTSTQWCFDIQWCPRNPAVLSAAAFDGHISIYSIMGGSNDNANNLQADQLSSSFGNMDPFGTGKTLPPLQLPQQTSPQSTITPLKKPPKWIRRPVGASFAFGGKLVTLDNIKPTAQQPQQTAAHVVHISQVVTETDFIHRSNQLQTTLNAGNFLEYCQNKIETVQNEFERTVWSFLKVNFEEDARLKYLELLGYEKEELALKIASALEGNCKPKEADMLSIIPASIPLQHTTPAPDPLSDPLPDISNNPEPVLETQSEPDPDALLVQPRIEPKYASPPNLELHLQFVNDPIFESTTVPSANTLQPHSQTLVDFTPPVDLTTLFDLTPPVDLTHSFDQTPPVGIAAPVDIVTQVGPSGQVSSPEEQLDSLPLLTPSTCPQESNLALESTDLLLPTESTATMVPHQSSCGATTVEFQQSVPITEQGFGVVQTEYLEPAQASTIGLHLASGCDPLDAPGLSPDILPQEAVSMQVLNVDPQLPTQESDLMISVADLLNVSDCKLELQVEDVLGGDDPNNGRAKEETKLDEDKEEVLAEEEADSDLDDIPVNEEEPVVEETSNTEVPPAPASDAINLKVSQDIDGLITQALLTGDYEAAVNLCLHDNRMADGIILAIAGGPELLAKTQRKYFSKTESKISKLISAVVMKDWLDILETCDLQNWKEALAAVMTYAKPEEFSALCGLLGSRLESSEDVELQAQACLCYICAGTVEQLVSFWTKTQDSCSPLSLQELVEKVVVLQRAVEKAQGAVPADMGALLAEKMNQYASLLASQGSLQTAISYLPTNTEQVSVQQLRERLSRALGQHQHPQQPAAAVTGIQKMHQTRPAAVPMQTYSQPQPPAQPAAPAVPPQYYQQGRSATTVTSWSNQTPTALPSVPRQLVPSSDPQGDSTPPAFGLQSPAMASVPASTPFMYSQQYQNYPPVQQFTPSAGTPGIYQPLPYASSAGSPLPPPPSSSSAAVYPPQFMLSASSQASAPPQSFCPPPAVSSGGCFQHGGPGSPTSYLPPPGARAPGPQNGWNDPPALSRAAKKKKVPQHFTPPAPITAPIMAPLGDPQAPAGMQTLQPQQQVPDQSAGPATFTPIQQQPLGPRNPSMPQGNMEGAPGAPIGDVIKPLQAIPTEKITKKPIPEEHMVLKTTFEGLIQKCLTAASDPQTKRKLDDAHKRLELLYDKLREQTLSPAIIGGLHNMAHSIECRSYADGLNIHTHIVSNSNFSETSAFMPVLKVVLTQANKLGV
ncbi:protein transport protein Sec31A isoform X6 [Danio rerio]|uniref:Protein transport protein Sec31A n=1 Tax=Danio rerio TaxID=7955 RepID=A0A8M3B316_DANRE|nr:protein transport protein Sec31A isoform X4 [Danio rerio]|eukprot:XP_009303366.1 protein transport protein Sec31A isoform X4 [Danio rerio]